MDVVGWILAIAVAGGWLAYRLRMRERGRMQRADERTTAEMDPRRRERIQAPS